MHITANMGLDESEEAAMALTLPPKWFSFAAADGLIDALFPPVLPVGPVCLAMAGLFAVEAERARLGRQIDDAQGEVARTESKLANEQFRTRAPAAIVAQEQERLDTARGRLDGLRQSIAEVGE